MTAPVMIMAGGTGGHIFPALAVAESLQRRDVPVIWLGSRGGMETRLVPAKGIPLVELTISGLRGNGIKRLAVAPFKLVLALSQAIKAQLKYKPQAVLGLGGFASGPGGLAAWILRTPLYVHEQNSIPGLTNKLLARLSRCVMQAFPQSFDAARFTPITVGNPVRKEFLSLADPVERLSSRKGSIRILIVGGSLGALKLNQVVPETLAGLDAEIEIWHQTGKQHLQNTKESYEQLNQTARVAAFIEDMSKAYGWADLVIGRAGALTVSELAQVGVASILIPYPHAVDDHQTANANNLVSRDAARMLADSELSVDALSKIVAPLVADRQKLIAMAIAATSLRRSDAADVVAKICLGELDPAQLRQEAQS